MGRERSRGNRRDRQFWKSDYCLVSVCVSVKLRDSVIPREGVCQTRCDSPPDSEGRPRESSQD
jgi:hypothetical protein